MILTNTPKWIIILSFFVFLLYGCSVEEMILDKLADSLSSGMGTSFTSDDDPELIGDALPFALKLYDSLLEQNPHHQALLLATGSAYIMYANAYVQTPALMLPQEEYKKKSAMLERAKRLYLRGRDLVLNALELRYPGFLELLDNDNLEQALTPMQKDDVPYLYWAGAGWFAAYSLDAFDIGLGITAPRALALMQKALDLDDEFNEGAIHDFFISYYGAMPEGMGRDEEKARFHFQREVAISKGKCASPYVALATTVCINNQDAAEFKSLLNQALAINPDDNPGNRLANIINQRKAQWYLDHIEDFIIF